MGINPDEHDLSIEKFRQWIRSGAIVFDRNKYLIDDDVCVDYFIRYENLPEGIAHVCKALAIPFDSESIPRLKIGNRSREIPVKEFYDDESIETVARIYRFELERFGYSLPE